jgi:hypothetical protein
MKAIQEGWTIVLLGGWNMAILTPQWISEHLVKQSTVDIEVLVTPGNQPQIRYKASDFVLTPSPQRLVFNMLRATDEVLLRLEAMVIRLLGALPHTPVSATGVNFRFSEDEDIRDLTHSFDFGDSTALADFGATVSATELLRSLSYEDTTINFKLIHQIDKIVFDFNFHNNVQPTADDAMTARLAVRKLENAFVPRKTLCLRMLRQVYKREIDPDGE